MRTVDFDYTLPPERIAQQPVEPRDASRLLVLERQSGRLEHARFWEMGRYLRPGDILVANDSRVLPARLFGRKSTGGQVEVLLLRQRDPLTWTALLKGRRLHTGATIQIVDHADQLTDLVGRIEDHNHQSQRTLVFNTDILPHLDRVGHTPLPPYIHNHLSDPERYQTVYARRDGSAAAPTAGLHFTPDLLLHLRAQGVLFETVTLHVGLDTFQPVQTEQLEDHPLHQEWVSLTAAAAERINRARLAGGRIVAVGTTTVRVLETAALRSAGATGTLRAVSQEPPPAACPWRPVAAYTGMTDLYIYPGYHFRAVEALITNFHLPQSTLLMLTAAFAGRERVLAAYQTAIAEGYRFYSLGDAMLIL